MVRIENMPMYAKQYGYVVYRTDGKSNWFWGAYETLDEAVDVAKQMDAKVCTIDEVDGEFHPDTF